MSETSTLISCTGKITRAELATLPTPPATETHIPIAHAAVVDTLVETLSHRHIGIVGEEFAVSSDGMEMFGVLDLEAGFEGCRFAIGIRNANNKRFRLACTIGLRVFVCYNLAFRGDYTPVLAKHSMTCISIRSTRNSRRARCGGFQTHSPRPSRNWIRFRNLRRQRNWESFWSPDSPSLSSHVAVPPGPPLDCRG
jgi:hypothetical protein